MVRPGAEKMQHMNRGEIREETLVPEGSIQSDPDARLAIIAPRERRPGETKVFETLSKNERLEGPCRAGVIEVTATLFALRAECAIEVTDHHPGELLARNTSELAPEAVAQHWIRIPVDKRGEPRPDPKHQEDP